MLSAKERKYHFNGFTRVIGKFGMFLRDSCDCTYYLDNETCLVTAVGSVEFKRMMSGYNLDLPDTRYNELVQDYALKTGIKCNVHRLGFYDRNNHAAYVYSQGSEVYKITADGTVATIVNGDDHLYFIREKNASPFTYDPSVVGISHITDALKMFSIAPDGPISAEHANLFLLTWICSLFLESLVPVRPILMLVGKTGSGKTQLMKILSVLISGNDQAIRRIDNSRKLLDHSIINSGFVVFDNFTDYKPWLSRRIETIAGHEYFSTEANGHIIDHKIQCGLAITSRSILADVRPLMNRILPIVLDGPKGPHVLPSAINSHVEHSRNMIMSSVIQAIRSLLVTMESASNTNYSGRYFPADFAQLAIQLGSGTHQNSELLSSFEMLADASSHVMNTPEDTLLRILKDWAPKNTGKPMTPNEIKKAVETEARKAGISFELKPREFTACLKRVVDRLKHFFDVTVKQGRSRYLVYCFGVKTEVISDQPTEKSDRN